MFRNCSLTRLSRSITNQYKVQKSQPKTEMESPIVGPERVSHAVTDTYVAFTVDFALDSLSEYDLDSF